MPSTRTGSKRTRSRPSIERRKSPTAAQLTLALGDEVVIGTEASEIATRRERSDIVAVTSDASDTSSTDAHAVDDKGDPTNAIRAPVYKEHASGTWGFVDEYGNTNIATEKPGVSQYFIVVTILAPGSELQALRHSVEKIRAKFFQTGEMKSKSLGSNRARWEKLLRELSTLPFHFHALAVDKVRLDRAGGLQHKEPFYKFMCGLAYRKTMGSIPNLHVRADEHGRTEFMTSFQEHVRKNHRPSLFDHGTFEFVNGKQDVLIQLADIVAGLLARIYDPEKQLRNSKGLLELLADRALLIEDFPLRYGLDLQQAQAVDERDPDRRIARHAHSLARDFIEKNENSNDDDVRARVAVVESLLARSLYFDDSKAMSTAELLSNLQARGFHEAGDTWLRRSVIGPLRDKGLLITSSSRGYKLPGSRADLVTFGKYAESICIPMLSRVGRACDIVKLATVGEIDVLKDEAVGALKKLISALDERASVLEPIEP